MMLDSLPASETHRPATVCRLVARPSAVAREKSRRIGCGSIRISASELATIGVPSSGPRYIKVGRFRSPSSFHVEAIALLVFHDQSRGRHRADVLNDRHFLARPRMPGG